MIRMMLALVALLFVAGSARAGGAVRYDGIVAACQPQVRAGQSGLRDCLLRGLAEGEAALAAAGERAMTRARAIELSGGGQFRPSESLQVAQQTFFTFRESECRWRLIGQAARIGVEEAYWACLADLTWQRAYDLDRIASAP
jgi:uncharacterized protein YecT (DUF1311 family)